MSPIRGLNQDEKDETMTMITASCEHRSWKFKIKSILPSFASRFHALTPHALLDVEVGEVIVD